MEVVRAPSGAIVVNDAYNANPDSMLAALEALASIDGPAARRHRRCDGRARRPGRRTPAGRRGSAGRWGIELIATGTDLYGVAPVDDPVAALGAIGDGDAVLVKASRVAGLERVAQALLDG